MLKLEALHVSLQLGLRLRLACRADFGQLLQVAEPKLIRGRCLRQCGLLRLIR